MISFATLALATGMLQGQSTVNITPLGESPFVLRDKNIDMFPKQCAIESKDDSKPGLFMITESQFEERIYELAKQYLNGSKVEAIVRRTGKTTLEAWNMNGSRLSISTVEIPDGLSDALQPNELAIKIRRRQHQTDNKRESCSFQFATRTHRVSQGYEDSWTVVASPKYSAIDVLIPISGKTEIGEISPQIGSEATIDGVLFKVTDEQKQRGTLLWIGPRVAKFGQQEFFTYVLGIEFDQESFDKANRDLHLTERSIHCSVQTADSDHRSLDNREINVSSNLPFKFWKSLIISRHFMLNGYISHVPTEPTMKP